MYRVIRAFMPKRIGFRIWDCKNITFRNMHNYTQILPVIEFPIYDMNKKLPVYSWDFARLTVWVARRAFALPARSWTSQ